MDFKNNCIHIIKGPEFEAPADSLLKLYSEAVAGNFSCFYTDEGGAPGVTYQVPVGKTLKIIAMENLINVPGIIGFYHTPAPIGMDSFARGAGAIYPVEDTNPTFGEIYLPAITIRKTDINIPATKYPDAAFAMTTSIIIYCKVL